MGACWGIFYGSAMTESHLPRNPWWRTNGPQFFNVFITITQLGADCSISLKCGKEFDHVTVFEVKGPKLKVTW